MVRYNRNTVDDNREPDPSTWMLKEILLPTQLRALRRSGKNPFCRTRDCELVGCLHYERQIDGVVDFDNPDSSTFLCFDCQERRFNGWPLHDETPDIDMSKRDWTALIQHASRNIDGQTPPFPILRCSQAKREAQDCGIMWSVLTEDKRKMVQGLSKLESSYRNDGKDILINDEKIAHIIVIFHLKDRPQRPVDLFNACAGRIPWLQLVSMLKEMRDNKLLARNPQDVHWIANEQKNAIYGELMNIHVIGSRNAHNNAPGPNKGDDEGEHKIGEDDGHDQGKGSKTSGSGQESKHGNDKGTKSGMINENDEEESKADDDEDDNMDEEGSEEYVSNSDENDDDPNSESDDFGIGDGTTSMDVDEGKESEEERAKKDNVDGKEIDETDKDDKMEDDEDPGDALSEAVKALLPETQDDNEQQSNKESDVQDVAQQIPLVVQTGSPRKVRVWITVASFGISNRPIYADLRGPFTYSSEFPTDDNKGQSRTKYSATPSC